MVTGCILIVMPRSRSRSIASSICSPMARIATVFVTSSRRSESVVLPWSMCAMMQKLRTLLAVSRRCGRSGLFKASVAGVAHTADRVRDRRLQQPLDNDDQHQKREVQSTERRDDAAQRLEHRFDHRGEIV